MLAIQRCSKLLLSMAAPSYISDTALLLFQLSAIPLMIATPPYMAAGRSHHNPNASSWEQCSTESRLVDRAAAQNYNPAFTFPHERRRPNSEHPATVRRKPAPLSPSGNNRSQYLLGAPQYSTQPIRSAPATATSFWQSSPEPMSSTRRVSDSRVSQRWPPEPADRARASHEILIVPGPSDYWQVSSPARANSWDTPMASHPLPHKWQSSGMQLRSNSWDLAGASSSSQDQSLRVAPLRRPSRQQRPELIISPTEPLVDAAQFHLFVEATSGFSSEPMSFDRDPASGGSRPPPSLAARSSFGYLPRAAARTPSQIFMDGLSPDDEYRDDDELPDYAQSQREAAQQRRREATRRAEELEQRWMSARRGR